MRPERPGRVQGHPQTWPHSWASEPSPGSTPDCRQGPQTGQADRSDTSCLAHMSPNFWDSCAGQETASGESHGVPSIACLPFHQISTFGKNPPIPPLHSLEEGQIVPLGLPSHHSQQMPRNPGSLSGAAQVSPVPEVSQGLLMASRLPYTLFPRTNTDSSTLNQLSLRRQRTKLQAHAHTHTCACTRSARRHARTHTQRNEPHARTCAPTLRKPRK